MTIIRIKPNQCTLEDEADVDFLQRLDNELSFMVQGAEHTKAYKGYWDHDGNHIKWDGMHRLLSEKLAFPTGLRQRVQEFCETNRHTVQIVDERPQKSVGNQIDIIPSLRALGRDPYPYQLEITDIATKEDCGIIRAATGAGKSQIAALIISKLGKSAILYVIGTDLLYQLHKVFTSIFDQPIGIVGDGLCEIHDINIVSVWTAGKALGLKGSIVIEDDSNEKKVDPHNYSCIRNLLSNTKVHIFDECHLAACETIQTIATNINPEHLYGMSASPWRDDGADLLIEAVLGKTIVDMPASYLIERGYLVKPIIKFIKVPAYPTKIKSEYQTIYRQYITENIVRNGMVCNVSTQLIKQGYRVLVLYRNIKHGQTIYSQLQRQSSCALLSGKDSSDAREKVKEQLEKHNIDCIIASSIYDLGVDLPCLSGLVLAGSGKSSVRALQRVGRVIRKYPDKKRAAVVDFVDNAKYLKDHSKRRAEIYMTEPAFEVHY